MVAKFLDTSSLINQWGNGLAFRLNKPIAETAGMVAGTPVKVHVEPGKITIETNSQTETLEQLLARFDPQKHGGEVMAFEPVGREVF